MHKLSQKQSFTKILTNRLSDVNSCTKVELQWNKKTKVGKPRTTMTAIMTWNLPLSGKTSALCLSKQCNVAEIDDGGRRDNKMKWLLLSDGMTQDRYAMAVCWCLICVIFLWNTWTKNIINRSVKLLSFQWTNRNRNWNWSLLYNRWYILEKQQWCNYQITFIFLFSPFFFDISL